MAGDEVREMVRRLYNVMSRDPDSGNILNHTHVVTTSVRNGFASHKFVGPGPRPSLPISIYIFNPLGVIMHICGHPNLHVGA